VRRSRHDLTDLELRRQGAARAAVAQERVRIARELHDIVAHSVTIMVLQAAGARRVLRGEAPRVDQALADIESTGRQTMGELRRLLRLLATSGTYADDDLNELEPHPGLADVPGVISRVTAAGLSVEVRERGAAVPLDMSVDLAAYRMVSEALTNALKHGGAGAHAVIQLDWHEGGLTVTVTDDGRGQPHAESDTLSNRTGLLGLGERVRAIDGVLDAGPRSDGGYRISVILPTTAAVPAVVPPTAVPSAVVPPLTSESR
jgi:signal transduction histidine kinase